MDRPDPDVVAIVNKLKDGAGASPWIPGCGIPPPERYHHLPHGLSLCFTLDIFREFKYWHLSIVRVPGGPTGEELDFWRRAFFAENPIIEVPGLIPGITARHFFWRAE